MNFEGGTAFGSAPLPPAIPAQDRATAPVAIVLEPSILPEEAKGILASLQECVSSRLPVYYSFASAANAINLVLSYNERRAGKLGT